MIQFLLLILVVVIAVKLFKPDFTDKLFKRKSQKLVLDSCALIDGRILDLAQSGFMTQELIVPDFVLHELQLLADGVDAHKRERARSGLELIKELQALGNPAVIIDHTTIDGKMATDDKLLELCKKLDAKLYTTDFNLQKVAEIGGVSVLNVNDIAQKLRPSALPGEKKTVKLLQKGSNQAQAVGYLEDGTMVVVENGAKYIGRTAEVEITRTHQTVSGKMLFADLLKVSQKSPTTQPEQTAKPGLPKYRTSKAISKRPPLARLPRKRISA